MSFFEWVQNLQNFRWEEDEVNKRLDRLPPALWMWFPRLHRCPLVMRVYIGVQPLAGADVQSSSLLASALPTHESHPHGAFWTCQTVFGSPGSVNARAMPEGGVSRAYGCRVMTESFGHIWEIAQQKKLPLRTAAFVKALQSVTRAHLHRGFD